MLLSIVWVGKNKKAHNYVTCSMRFMGQSAFSVWTA